MKHARVLQSATAGLGGAHLLVLTAALLLCGVPLADTLGFEFAAAIGFLVAYVAGWRAAGAAARARSAATALPAPFPGAALWRVAASNLSLLAPPLAVMAVRALWVPACSWSQGFAFYALLPLPAWLYGTAVGFALGLALPAGRARLAFVGWSFLTYAHGLWRLLVEPPKFAFNPFVGYFPGPIYDGEVAVSPPLLVARGVVVATALFVLCLASVAWDGTRIALRGLPRRARGDRAVAGLVAAVLALVLLLARVFGAPLGIAVDRQTIQATLGGHLETAHIHLYYDRSALTRQRARALADEHELRYAQLARFFGCEPPRKLGSYVYGSAAQKKRLMGAAGTSFEDAWNDEFHINVSSEEPHPTLTHEMAHLFAAQLVPHVPVCWKIGIHEGIAVAAEWNEESARLELTVDQAGAAMDSLGLLPRLERSLSAAGFWTQPGPRVYTACGSFVRYLLERGGMERFRVLWRRGDFEAAYGVPLAALLGEWRATLHRVPIGPRELRRAELLYRPGGIFQEPCGHELARLEGHAARALGRGDHTAAQALGLRLVQLDPENPERRLALAEIQVESGDLAAARRTAGSLLESSRAGPGQLERAWRLLGDLAWQAGDLVAADSAYARGEVLAASAADRRALEVRRTALGEPLGREALRRYLLGRAPQPVPDVAALCQAREQAPGHPLPRYLLGRRLVLAGDSEAGAAELRRALSSPGLGPEATSAGLELLGRSELALGRFQAALEAFRRLLEPEIPDGGTPGGLARTPQLVLNEGQKLGILDWVERVEWAAARAASAPATGPGPQSGP